jgi:putative ABC transport system substrate-binding protein
VIVKQRLNELGYSEGKNLTFDYRSAEGQLERLPQLAAESVATNPDVIVTGFGTETAKAAQVATTTIPIVFTSAGDPIIAGIVNSLKPARRKHYRSHLSDCRTRGQAAAGNNSAPTCGLSR